MKNLLTKLLIGTSLLFSGSFITSCDNSLVYEGPTREVVNLVREPDVTAYSGDKVLGNVFGTRAINHGMSYGHNVNGNMWSQDWDCVDNVYPDLTDEDLAEIKRLLSPGHEVENDIIIPFGNYWVQQVYKGEDYYNTHDRCTQAGCNHENSQTELGSGHMEHLKANNGGNYEHINNFNNGDNQTTFGKDDGCGITHTGTTLMTGMSTEGITPNNQFGYDETWGTQPKFFNNYYIIEYKGYYYVGFDYEAHKNDQTTTNHGEGMDIERDWNFTDWIVRISPAYAKGTTPEAPGTTDPDPDPDPDPEVPGVVIPDDPDPGFGVTPENPTDTIKDHVEINLAIDQKDESNWLATHLSIHVRANTDVEVFIPLPAKYYCSTDDMAIVQKHEGELAIHGGPRTVTYNINGNPVTLTVKFEENGIRVTTDGINQDVIDYCQNTYGDGLTFEVWNYMNILKDEWNVGEGEMNPGADNRITKEELRNCLNQSTVKFLDNDPSLYVNAFNDTASGDRFEDDCTVKPQNYYPYQGEDYWYNGSPYNQMYYNKE